MAGTFAKYSQQQSSGGGGGGGGTVTSVSANSPYLSVANPTTTPAITFDPTSIDLVYDGSGNLLFNGPTQQIQQINANIVIDFGQMLIYDGAGAESIDWDVRLLEDASADISIDWANRYLVDSNGLHAADYGNRNLSDNSSIPILSLDWQARQLFDPNQSPVIDYGITLLLDHSGTQSLDWSNGGANNGSLALGNPGTSSQHSLNTATSAPAAGAGTITNLPTGFSGNPAGYISIVINGNPQIIPYW